MNGYEKHRVVEIMSRLAVPAILLVGLVACQPDYYIDTETVEWVGIDGGVVYGPKGSRVIVPVEAVPQPVRLVMDEVSAEELPDLIDENGDALPRISMGLWLAPEGLHFDRKIEVGMRYIGEDMTEEMQQRTIRVFETPHNIADWKELETTVDVKSKMVRFEVDHLGVFSVFRVEAEEDDTNDEIPVHDPCVCISNAAEFCPDTGTAIGGLERIEIQDRSDETCSMNLLLWQENQEDATVLRVVPCDVVSTYFYAPDEMECALNWDDNTGNFQVNCGGDRIDSYSIASCN